MSVSRDIRIDCTECGFDQATTIWSSINVTIDPELKLRLLSGDINSFSCQKCGQATFVAVPLLYHDMDNQFCVQFYPPDSLKKPEFYNDFDENGREKVLVEAAFRIEQNAPQLLSPHVVFDMMEMIRYVVFRQNVGQGHGLSTP